MKKMKRFILTFLFFTVFTSLLNWLLSDKFETTQVLGHIIAGLLFALTSIPIEKVYEEKFKKKSD